MYVPFISSPRRRNLFRRKGGGGRGGGGGKGIGSSSGSGKSGITSKSSSSTSKSKTGSVSVGKTQTRTNGYVPPRTITTGFFAGRTEGGASRDQIYGTRTYGSGYPNVVGRGVAGRGFPFFFWPIVWPGAVIAGVGTAAYLHSESEYGSPTNSSRPGGPLAYATFPSSSTSPPTVIFRISSDNATITSLIPDLTANCTRFLSNSSSYPNNLSTSPTPFAPPFTFSNVTGPANPQPEQVVEYYRASTIALSLDSYNNTAVNADEGTPDIPLPSLGSNDSALLDCLNITIGLAAPLVSSGRPVVIQPTFLFVFWFMFWVLFVI